MALSLAASISIDHSNDKPKILFLDISISNNHYKLGISRSVSLLTGSFISVFEGHWAVRHALEVNLAINRSASMRIVSDVCQMMESATMQDVLSLLTSELRTFT
jgi:hypothetical protein